MSTIPCSESGSKPEIRVCTHVHATAPLILIIDDDDKLGKALVMGLESRGYRALAACTSEASLQLAHEQLPDLILCDINMPGKSGLRLLEDLRGDAELANCQFVFMTGNPRYAEPRLAMDLGADDFLLKPFSLDALVSCVAARLRRSEISGYDEVALVKSLREGLRRGLPHEFFTPLTGIIGFAEMLEQEGTMMKAEECREALRHILNSGRRLHRTLRNYIYAVDRLEPDSAAPFPVLAAESVKQLVQQGVAAAADRHERHADLEVEISGEPLAGGARELALLVEELTDNAFSFSRPHSPVRVHAGRVDAEFHIMIRDQGRGMTRRQLKELGLFRQFERPQYEQQGLGVGLFIVEQAVRRLGGRLQFESEKDTGTLCRVMLPVATNGASRHHG